MKQSLYDNSAWAIRPCDLPSIKKILAVLFEGTDLKPSNRMEVFARLAGYKSYQSFRSMIADVPAESPFPVDMNTPHYCDFMVNLSMESKRVISELMDEDIFKLIQTARELVCHPRLGQIRPEEELSRAEIIKQSKVLPPVSDHFDGRILLVLTPRNIEVLHLASNGTIPQNDKLYGRILYTNDASEQISRKRSAMALDESKILHSYKSGVRIAVFDKKDIGSIKAVYPKLPDAVFLNAIFLEPQISFVNEDQVSSFSDAYYSGVVHGSQGDKLFDANYCMNALLDIEFVVRFYHHTYNSMVLGR